MVTCKLLLSTASSREEAQTIAQALVDGRLAACVNILGPIESVYRWKGEVEKSQEFLMMIKTTAERFNAVARSHWGIENRLHWRLDVIMNEDQDRNRMDNSPYNLAILRHMALNVMRKEGSKGSLRGKFKRAGWDDTFLRKLLAAF